MFGLRLIKKSEHSTLIEKIAEIYKYLAIAHEKIADLRKEIEHLKKQGGTTMEYKLNNKNWGFEEDANYDLMDLETNKFIVYPSPINYQNYQEVCLAAERLVSANPGKKVAVVGIIEVFEADVPVVQEKRFVPAK